MNLSALFIARPVATILLTLGVILLGAIALPRLPVAPLPAVEVPTIKVSAALPGASPDTMATAVATPLERALGRIAGVTEMTSTSVAGAMQIVLLFDPGRDMDGAARDVQGALNAARSELPADLPGNPRYRAVSSSDAPVLVLALTSASTAPAAMYQAAATVLAQKLAQIPGVGQVDLEGSALPAVRVELDPTALAHFGMGFDDVRRAITAADVQRPAGGFDQGEQHWQFATGGALDSAAAFRRVVVSYRDGAAVYLRDVAQVLDSVENPWNVGLANGQPAVLAIVRGKPVANIVQMVDRINAELPALRAALPAAIRLQVMMDRTATVRSSLRTATHTLGIAMVLVVLVMLLFLRDVRMALIASVAAPISIFGTFAAMYVLGYSLDILSLMALTIAVGFAVDDAVVVVENIARHLERGVPAHEAAARGAREVGLTVLSMSAVLVAVFIPLLFMGGYAGLFVREFAVTIVIVIAFSLVVSLTIVPMLCAMFLRPATAGKRRGRLHRSIGYAFARLQRAYARSLGWTLAHQRVTLVVLAGVIGLNVVLYVVVSKGFFPRQDTGQLTGSIQLGDSGSFPVLQRQLERFAAIVRADPAVESVTAYAGGDDPDSGSLFATLKPLSTGRPSADAVAARLRISLEAIAGATIALQSVQDIRVGGRRSRSNYQYTVQADDPALLRVWLPRIVSAMQKQAELKDVSVDAGNRGLETFVHIDRDAAARLGVTVTGVDSVLHDAFAQRRVATLYGPQQQYRVVMGVAPKYAQSPQAFDDLGVTGAGDQQVPLTSFARISQRPSARAVDHAGQFVATTIAFDLTPGASLSQATGAIRRAVGGLALPSSVRGEFEGSARAFRQVQGSQPALILAALLTLFIVLGMLYESITHPLTILSTLPSAGVGALLALMMLHTDFNVIALIGVFALAGIVMKNAIMMVDFALVAQRESGMTSRAAIRRACLLRFRPILMTSLAVFLAAIPLAVARGGGAEMRQPLGIAIGGGLIASQLLTLYTTPVVFLYLDRLNKWVGDIMHRWTTRLGADFPAGRGEAS